MSKRVSVVLSDEVAELLEKLANDERRSQSQMGALLIEEALRGRQNQQSFTPNIDQKTTEPPPTKGKRK